MPTNSAVSPSIPPSSPPTITHMSRLGATDLVRREAERERDDLELAAQRLRAALADAQVGGCWSGRWWVGYSAVCGGRGPCSVGTRAASTLSQACQLHPHSHPPSVPPCRLAMGQRRMKWRRVPLPPPNPPPSPLLRPAGQRRGGRGGAGGTAGSHAAGAGAGAAAQRDAAGGWVDGQERGREAGRAVPRCSQL